MVSKNKSKRGDLANRKSSDHKNKDKIDRISYFPIVFVFYWDHIEFRNSNSITMNPLQRVAVGWLIHESSDAIWILYDRPAKKLIDVKTKESGFIILKSDIIAVVPAPFDNCFICIQESILGNINP